MAKVDRSILQANDQNMGNFGDPNKLENSIAHLADTIDGIDNDTSTLKTDNTSHKSRLTALEGGVSTLETENTSNKSKITVLEGDNANNKNRLTNLETDNASNKGKIATNESNIAYNEGRLVELLRNEQKASEVVDARMGFPVLRDKLENVDSQLADIVTLKPNGVDDTAALQAYNGKHIKLSEGTFICSPLVFNANTHIEGSGMNKTIILLKDNSNATLIHFKNAYNSSLRNLSLNGNKGKNIFDSQLDPYNSVLKVSTTSDNPTSSYNTFFKDLFISNGANNGLTLNGIEDGHYYNWVMHFDNVFIRFCEGYGFYDNTSDNKFSKFYINQCKKAGMYLNASSNVYTDFKVDYCGETFTNNESVNEGANIIVTGSDNLHFMNLDSQSSYHAGMKIIGSAKLIIEGNMNNNGIAYPQNHDDSLLGIGLYIINSRQITGNLLFFTVTPGVQNRDVIIDSLSDNVSITSGTINQNKIVNDGTKCLVISLADSFSHAIQNKVTMDYLTTNLLRNSEFGTTSYWSGGGGSTLSVANGDLINTGTGVTDYPNTVQATITPLNLTHKYYFRAKVSVLNNVATKIESRLLGSTGGSYKAISSQSAPAQNVDYILSNVVTPNATSTGNLQVNIYHMYPDAATANGKQMTIKDISLVDLTEVFGSGNEPTKEEMDSLLSSIPLGDTPLSLKKGSTISNFYGVIEKLYKEIQALKTP